MMYMILAHDNNNNKVSFKICSRAINFSNVVKLAEKHCAKRNVKLSAIM